MPTSAKISAKRVILYQGISLISRRKVTGLYKRRVQVFRGSGLLLIVKDIEAGLRSVPRVVNWGSCGIYVPLKYSVVVGLYSCADNGAIFSQKI